MLVPKSFTVLAFLEGVFILGCIGTVYGLTRQWQLPWPAPAPATAAVAIGANLIVYYNPGSRDSGRVKGFLDQAGLRPML
jgi:hypothetical protein